MTEEPQRPPMLPQLGAPHMSISTEHQKPLMKMIRRMFKPKPKVFHQKTKHKKWEKQHPYY